jgi:oxygen-independent coproporphyrinogen III oxidase
MKTSAATPANAPPTTPLPQLDLTARYQSYAYSYPHKSAYRPFTPPRTIRDIWANAPTDSLFLYAHVPFCEMRCGFCNLFTYANPAQNIVSDYLDAFTREAHRVRAALGDPRFTQAAVGGGTPTYLDESQLDRFFDVMSRTLGAPLGRIPMSVETSPRTATREKMRLLKARGATRVSIGVQSFVESEVADAGRAQSNRLVLDAVAHIKEAQIPTLNLDLIYGLHGQTVASWLASLQAALALQPQEIYAYPLYVRPLTGLGRAGEAWDDLRDECYARGREFLLAHGFTQVSMRMFRANNAPVTSANYCCQDDGMVGVGCGARSYTKNVHYSREFAVARDSVRAVIADYLACSDNDFDIAVHGVTLDESEQRRRFVIKSILRIEGLSLAAYADSFSSDAPADFPELASLIDAGYLIHEPGFIRPTALGLASSDSLGPAFYSPAMRAAMNGFTLK